MNDKRIREVYNNMISNKLSVDKLIVRRVCNQGSSLIEEKEWIVEILSLKPPSVRVLVIPT